MIKLVQHRGYVKAHYEDGSRLIISEKDAAMLVEEYGAQWVIQSRYDGDRGREAQEIFMESRQAINEIARKLRAQQEQ
jgi:hypothetical protein